MKYPIDKAVYEIEDYLTKEQKKEDYSEIFSAVGKNFGKIKIGKRKAQIQLRLEFDKDNWGEE